MAIPFCFVGCVYLVLTIASYGKNVNINTFNIAGFCCDSGRGSLQSFRTGKATALGRILGQGVEATAKAFDVPRVPAVKGQSLPAHEAHAIKSVGITYATSTMGADHTAGYHGASDIAGLGGKVDPLAGFCCFSKDMDTLTKVERSRLSTIFIELGRLLDQGEPCSIVRKRALDSMSSSLSDA